MRKAPGAVVKACVGVVSDVRVRARVHPGIPPGSPRGDAGAGVWTQEPPQVSSLLSPGWAAPHQHRPLCPATAGLPGCQAGLRRDVRLGRALRRDLSRFLALSGEGPLRARAWGAGPSAPSANKVAALVRQSWGPFTDYLPKRQARNSRTRSLPRKCPLPTTGLSMTWRGGGPCLWQQQPNRH